MTVWKRDRAGTIAVAGTKGAGTIAGTGLKDPGIAAVAGTRGTGTTAGAKDPGIATGAGLKGAVHSRKQAGRRAYTVQARSRAAAADMAARIFLAVCAAISCLAVTAIALYMIQGGLPALMEVGWREILLGRVWDPVGTPPKFGILLIVLTSLFGTFLAVLLGATTGVLTAVFLAELANGKAAWIVGTAVDLLAGIPSVIYGLLGIYVLNPLVYRLERKVFAGSDTHQFTGGANLLCAVLVLAVMILPTVISVSRAAILSVEKEVRASSLALGASRIQTIFRSVLPAARSGVAAAVVLGVGRALGESMAVMLVAGNRVNVPLPFHSVRFLTTAIVSEMGYAQGTHRRVLFAIGLVLFVFITLVNGVILGMLKKEEVQV